MLHKNEWDSIQISLSNLYPNEIDNIDKYKIMFQRLRTIQPHENNEQMEIVIEFTKDYCDENDNEEWLDVYGRKPNDPYKYGIEYVGWEKWLGYTISNQTLDSFPESQIIAHCLYELSWGGFTPEEQLENIESFNKSIEDLDE